MEKGVKGWINIYDESVDFNHQHRAYYGVYPTKEEALSCADENVVATIEVEYTIEQDPFALVPTSWEQYIESRKGILSKESMTLAYQGFCYVTYNVNDARAFNALAKLRLIWHEWIEVLGEPKEDKDRYVICYNKYYDKIVPVGNNSMFEGVLVFKEESHAEKFIECFGDLLEKAKILL